jgi:hypothetical protein
MIALIRERHRHLLGEPFDSLLVDEDDNDFEKSSVGFDVLRAPGSRRTRRVHAPTAADVRS